MHNPEAIILICVGWVVIAFFVNSDYQDVRNVGIGLGVLNMLITLGMVVKYANQ